LENTGGEQFASTTARFLLEITKRHVLADPDAAARRIVEIANAAEAVQERVSGRRFRAAREQCFARAFKRPHGNNSGFLQP